MQQVSSTHIDTLRNYLSRTVYIMWFSIETTVVRKLRFVEIHHYRYIA